MANAIFEGSVLGPASRNSIWVVVEGRMGSICGASATDMVMLDRSCDSEGKQYSCLAEEDSVDSHELASSLMAKIDGKASSWWLGSNGSSAMPVDWSVSLRLERGTIARLGIDRPTPTPTPDEARRLDPDRPEECMVMKKKRRNHR